MLASVVQSCRSRFHTRDKSTSGQRKAGQTCIRSRQSRQIPCNSRANWLYSCRSSRQMTASPLQSIMSSIGNFDISPFSPAAAVKHMKVQA